MEKNILLRSVLCLLICLVLTSSVFGVGLTDEQRKQLDAVYAKHPSIPKGTLGGIVSAESKYGTQDTNNPFQITDNIYNKYGSGLSKSNFGDSAEIAAKYIEKEIITAPNYDRKASDEVNAQQIQVAYNRGPGNMPTSDTVNKILNDDANPYSAYAGSSLNQNQVTNRFINFNSGYLEELKSSPDYYAAVKSAQTPKSQTVAPSQTQTPAAGSQPAPAEAPVAKSQPAPAEPVNQPTETYTYQSPHDLEMQEIARQSAQSASSDSALGPHEALMGSSSGNPAAATPAQPTQAPPQQPAAQAPAQAPGQPAATDNSKGAYTYDEKTNTVTFVQGKSTKTGKLKDDTNGKYLVEFTDGKIMQYKVGPNGELQTDATTFEKKEGQIAPVAPSGKEGKDVFTIKPKTSNSKVNSNTIDGKKIKGSSDSENYYLYGYSIKGETEYKFSKTPLQGQADYALNGGQPLTKEHLDWMQKHNKDGVTFEVEGNEMIAKYDVETAPGAPTLSTTDKISMEKKDGAYAQQRVEEISANGNKLEKTYDIKNGQQTLTGLDSNMKLPFQKSTALDLNAKGELTYNGKVGKTVKDGWFEFKEGGFVREIPSELKDANGKDLPPVTVEMDSKGTLTVKEEGKMPMTIEGESGKAFLADSLDNPAKYDAAFRNIYTIKSAAEKNRNWDEEDYQLTPDGMVSKDGKTAITCKVRDCTYIQKDGDKTTKQVKYDVNQRVTEVVTMDGDKEYTSSYHYDEKGVMDIVTINGVSYTKGQKDFFYYAGPNKRIDLNANKVYVRDGENWKECKDCEEDKKSMEITTAEARFSSGGPTGREIAASKVFNVLESSQTGFGKLFSLFMGKDKLADWRHDVDNFFCDTVLLGGTDCWASKLCDSYTDKVGRSTLMIETPGGMADLAAHVEAERYSLLNYEGGEPQAEYLYKLSFAVKNPKRSGSEVYFNVMISGEAQIRLYNKDILVQEGEIYSRAGKKMIVQYSNVLYDKICLISPNKIPVPGGDEVSEICNDIVPVGSTPEILPQEYMEDTLDI